MSNTKMSETKLKFLNVIMKWSWIDTNSISNLTKTNPKYTYRILKELLENEFINFASNGNEKIYYLTVKGQKLITNEKRTVKTNVNLNEVKHKKLMVKFINEKGFDLKEYVTDEEIKRDEFWDKKFIPDLIYWDQETQVFVEIERSIKAKERILQKMSDMSDELIFGTQILWVSDDQKILNFLQNVLSNKKAVYFNEENIKYIKI